VAKGRYLPSVKETAAMLLTFSLTVFAWIFFRAPGLSFAVDYVGAIFSRSLFSKPLIQSYTLLPFICIMFVVEWLGREQPYGIAKFGINWPRPARWAVYYALIICIFYYAGPEQQFIYFQF